ncbi:MAG: hypothetical protein NC827_03125 [Candidatus Omnitrophica bacterium]|nr:hypothetical protein [Candidatus Omnitrophota bacterium]
MIWSVILFFVIQLLPHSKIFSSQSTIFSSKVPIYVFLSKDCPTCELVRPNNLNKLAEKIGCKIEPKYFDIDQIENYKKLCELEEKYKDTDNELPVVFIGEYVLGGEEEIRNNLERIIKEYAEKGGINWPDEIIEQNISKNTEKQIQTYNKKIYCSFFYEFNCKECQRIFYLLNYLEKKYPNIEIKRFNLKERESKIIFEAVAEKLNIPEKKRLIPATLIIGTNYLQEKEITLKNIETLIKKYEETGSICIWDLKRQEIEEAEKNILTRFKSFKFFTVVFAGLIDGVNPCAFAVLVFFISFLTTIKRKRKEVILVGFSFTFSAFLVYFLIGTGAFSFLSQFTYYKIFSKGLNILVGIGAIVLGIFSFFDFLKAKKGKVKEIKLQLPKPIKTKIHSTIIKKMSLPNYIFGAFLSGIIVSVLELACTGQVYLPTIVFVLNQPEFKRIGYFYLFLYNIFFIFPLLAILLLSYLGTTSQKLSQFSSKNLPAVKLILSLFFFTLGIYLLLRF